MDSMQGFDPCGMGSSPIKPTTITCGVTAALKTLNLQVQVRILSS